MTSTNMYQSTKPMPYVYLCTHKETGQFYYGYRCQNVKKKKVSQEDFPIYKTSSKYVNPIFDQFDWIIVAEFTNSNDAYDAEQKFIYETWNNSLSLNAHCNFGKSRWKSKCGVAPAKDINGNPLGLVSTKDPGWESGEIVGIRKGLPCGEGSFRKGMIFTKYKDTGEHFGYVSKDDFRYISGELVSINKGRKRPLTTEKARKSLSKSLKGISKPYMMGDNNNSKNPEVRNKISQKLKGLLLFNNGKIQRKFRLNEEPQGWVRGKIRSD